MIEFADIMWGPCIKESGSNQRREVYFSNDRTEAKEEAIQLTKDLIKHFELELKDLVG